MVGNVCLRLFFAIEKSWISVENIYDMALVAFEQPMMLKNFSS